jgi:tRNA(Ile)-lysidine synthase
MPESFIKIVRQSLAELGASVDDRFLIALSGGGDSTALALAMCEIAGVKQVVAAHLDHNVRPGSGKDREKVEQFCRFLGIPCITAILDPDEVANEKRKCGSLEGALRVLRYRFLERILVESRPESRPDEGIQWIVTGHTLDDQAETVMFRATRRMNWRSLQGIPAKRGRILRPMLGVTGAKARGYCRKQGISFLEDPSNRENSFTRNLIRNVTIPALVEQFHPDLKHFLVKVHQYAKALSQEENRQLEVISGYEGLDDCYQNSGRNFDLAAWMDLPSSLQEGAVIRYLDTALTVHPSSTLVADVVHFLRTSTSGSIDLPGDAVLELAYGKCKLKRAQTKNAFIPETAVRLPVPGLIDLPEAGISIVAEVKRLEGEFEAPATGTAYLSADKIGNELWVRGRLPGDRFIPLGMNQHRKVKDLLIDRKVPEKQRDAIPMVIDAHGAIVWVGGIEISQKAALEQVRGEEMVVLRILRIER